MSSQRFVAQEQREREREKTKKKKKNILQHSWHGKPTRDKRGRSDSAAGGNWKQHIGLLLRCLWRILITADGDDGAHNPHIAQNNLTPSPQLPIFVNFFAVVGCCCRFDFFLWVCLKLGLSWIRSSISCCCCYWKQFGDFGQYPILSLHYLLLASMSV